MSYSIDELLSVSNSLLTQHVQEVQQGELIYKKLFPELVVDSIEVENLVFGNEATKIYQSLKRAPFGPSNVAAVENITRTKIGLDEFDIQFPIDYTQTKAIVDKGVLKNSFDLPKRASEKALQLIELHKEHDCAVMSTDDSLYATSHKKIMTSSTSWYDADNGNMIDDVRIARAAITSGCGHEPNIGIFGNVEAFNNVVDKSYMVERTKYGGTNSQPGIVTLKSMAAILGLDDIFIAKSFYKNDSGVNTDIWGDYFILAYVKKPGNELGYDDADSYGITYQLDETPVVDEVRNELSSNNTFSKIKFERVTSFHKSTVLNYSAGYLFKNTTAK